MPNIPLADIPNAPGAGPAPVLRGGAGRIQMAPAPDLSGAQLDGRGIAKASALLGDAAGDIAQGNNFAAGAVRRELTQETVNPDAFTAEARGMQQLGGVIAQTGQVVEQFARARALAKDAVDMAKVDTLMRDEYAAHQDAIARNEIPEGKWVETWKARVPEIEKKLSALELSPRVRERVEADVIRFTSGATLDIARQETRRGIEVGRATILNAAERAFNDGDFESFEAHLEEGVNTGLLRADEKEAQMVKMEGARRVQLATATMSQNPQGFLDEMESAMAEKRAPEAFPWMQPTDVARFASTARSAVNNQKVELDDALDKAIAEGQVTTPDQVRALGAAGGLPQRVIEAKVQDVLFELRNTPEGRTAYTAASSELFTKVSSFDPRQDKDGTLALALRHEIKSRMDSGDREPLLDALSQRIKDGTVNARQMIQTSVFSAVDQLLSPNEEEKKALKDKPDSKLEADYIKRVQESLQIKREFLERQPKDPNDPNEAMTWLFERLRGSRAAVGAETLMRQQSKGGIGAALGFIWNNVLQDKGGGEMPDDAPPSADDITSKIGK